MGRRKAVKTNHVLNERDQKEVGAAGAHPSGGRVSLLLGWSDGHGLLTNVCGDELAPLDVVRTTQAPPPVSRHEDLQREGNPISHLNV